jgi:hypothetical protein
VNRTAENVFWLLALVYGVVVTLTLIKTAPGFGHHGFAAMPALTLTLPTSLVLMLITPKSIGLGGFISITAVGALANVGFVYLILFGLDHGENGDP